MAYILKPEERIELDPRDPSTDTLEYKLLKKFDCSTMKLASIEITGSNCEEQLNTWHKFYAKAACYFPNIRIKWVGNKLYLSK